MADHFSMDVTISDLEAYNLAAFDIDVSYDYNLLAFDSYSLTTELGVLDGCQASDWSLGDDEFGTVNINVFSWLDYVFDADFFSSQSDDFVLATLTFDADTASDLDEIYLSYIDLSDEYGDSFSYSVDGTDITAVPVPEPSTFLLMGTALFGIAGLRRRASN
jgi:hypothetical protein